MAHLLPYHPFTTETIGQLNANAAFQFNEMWMLSSRVDYCCETLEKQGREIAELKALLGVDRPRVTSDPPSETPCPLPDPSEHSFPK